MAPFQRKPGVPHPTPALARNGPARPPEAEPVMDDLVIPCILRFPGDPPPDLSGFAEPICFPVRVVWRKAATVEQTPQVQPPEPPDNGGLAKTEPMPPRIGNDPLNRVDHRGHEANVYVTPRPNGQQGYTYFAVDNLDNGNGTEGHVLSGQFNVTTSDSVSLPAGDYTLSPRPYIPPKSGIAGALQILNTLLSGNASGDPNRHVGVPVLSNTSDWNTIQLPNDGTMQGVEIHPGR
jgi:hypothetical protein